MYTISIGEPLIHLPSVDSTNHYAATLMQNQDVKEGTVILSDHQLKGKGQGGNHWFSEKHKNLLFSVILRPQFLQAEKQYYLSMCISNALTDLVYSVSDSASIKWPNDILIGRKKVAGILIENTVMGRMLHTSVVGIGLNVNQKYFPPELPDAASLCQIKGNDFNLKITLQQLLGGISENLEHLYSERFAIIRTNYLNRLWGLNEWMHYHDKTGRFEGRIIDVADSGELMIMTRNSHVRQYAFRELDFEL